MKLACAVVVGLFAGSAACSNSANPEEGDCPTSCVAGTPADACTVQTGACNEATGLCVTEPVPAGTSCGNGMTCDSNATCIGESFVGINEVESSGGTPGDWVELYNAGTETADIGGLILRDNDDTHSYTIPAGTMIEAGGYVVLEEADIGFGLGGADSARLFNGTTLLDSYEWTEHAATTYGRCPDMTGAFGPTTTSTKGAANDCGPAAVKVGINEVESDAGTPGDWVELYNAGTAAVDISGWIFRDADDTHNYAIPAGTMIAAGGYYVLEEADFAFGLGGADSARLFDGTTLVDSYVWTAHATTTYARCPDMTGAFGTSTTSTKGAANDCGAAAVQVGINEVESDAGTPGDWVELYNAGTAAVDIGGWIFRDSDDTHTYAIPAGTMIAAGAYVVLDEADFGFGLGGADSARLFNGTTLVDSYMWTAHATTTYGRCPNMTGPFATTTASTKGMANNCAAVVGINEVESDGGTPGDWVELYNAGSTAADIGGWIFRDSDDTHTYAIPAGTMIAAGGYVVLDEADFGFGLGGADSARLFNGTTLVDSYMWTAHATTTYGRCPNMTGAFATTTASTKSAANTCP